MLDEDTSDMTCDLRVEARHEWIHIPESAWCSPSGLAHSSPDSASYAPSQLLYVGHQPEIAR